MKSIKLASLFTAAMLLHRLGEAEDLNTMTVMNDNTAFACDLFGQLRSQPGNLFLSPYSISTALAMAYGGARGDTASQMASALHFSLPPEQLHPAFADLQKGLNAVQQKGQVKLAVANSLWPQKGYEFLPAYLALCEKQYGVTIQPVDFVHETETARKTINTWVEKMTNDKIRDLFQPGVLDPLTRMVLVNAIYFKGDWDKPFSKGLTQTAPFHLSPNQTVDAPLMRANGKYRYAETPDIQVLELPYAGHDLSMLILLPRQVDGLAALETSLTLEKLAAWRKDLATRPVQLWLPKFKLESQFSLNAKLAALGMTDAFTDRSDFSGMDGKHDLFLSAVVHKAFVEVNEEGTEAAAATGVAVAGRAMMRPEEPVVFRADHPFLFLICDQKTGSILFLGRLADPAR
jgi:serine protease inhibitor